MSTMSGSNTEGGGDSRSLLCNREGTFRTSPELQRRRGSDIEVGRTEEQGGQPQAFHTEPTSVLADRLLGQPVTSQAWEAQTEEEKEALWQEYCRLREEEEARKAQEEVEYHLQLRKEYERNR